MNLIKNSMAAVGTSQVLVFWFSTMWKSTVGVFNVGAHFGYCLVLLEKGRLMAKSSQTK